MTGRTVLWIFRLVPVRRSRTVGSAVGRAVRRLVRLSMLAGGAGALGAEPLLAQRPARAEAPVWLLVRPRVGDTLWVQVEQMVAMRGRPGDAPAPYGPRVDRLRERVQRVQLFAHSLVESSDLQRTTLLATTDSLALWAGFAGDEVAWRTMGMNEADRRVRMQVTPEGAMRLADPPPGARELGAALGSLPGLLPAGAVLVGSTWRREMPMPSLPVSGYRTDGVLQATLRLDSLSRGGRMAWISIEGALRRDGMIREFPVGTRVVTAGTVRGTMCVDRERAWIVDALTIIDVQSEMVTGPASAAPPTWIDVRIEQRLRVR